MKKRLLGSQGLSVSELGLGCMGMSEFYGKPDEKESIETLHKALALGITHFDTADIYGMGHNESLIGKTLKTCRDKIIIATKCGIVRDPANPEMRGVNGRPEYIRQCCENSLKRLNTDYIDLYYIHRTDPAIPVEETTGELSRLVSEGKIRYIGLSEASADNIERAHKIYPLSVIQSEYSLWTRGVEKEILSLCKKLNIGFAAYSPLGRGFLTGKIKTSDQFEKTDFRKTIPRFHPENIIHNLNTFDLFQKICEEKNCTPAQLALAWILAQSEHITAIPGTKKINYLAENVNSLNIHLSQHDLESLNQIFSSDSIKGSRYAPDTLKTYHLKE